MMPYSMEDRAYKLQLRDFFAAMRLDRRNQQLNRVLAERTRYITVALENIYQPHNASAVLRSCDCFGIQDVHIIENSNRYEVNPDVALGSAQWLTMHRYNSQDNNTADCISTLRRNGYRIIATVPNAQSVPIHDFDLSAGKFALLFGTERQGLTDEAIRLSDQQVNIPMYGFTESLNISVSVALCLFHFTGQIRQLQIAWQLSEDEALDIQLEWLRRNIPSSAVFEKRFRSTYRK